jgi:hypothetical protein
VIKTEYNFLNKQGIQSINILYNNLEGNYYIEILEDIDIIDVLKLLNLQGINYNII